MANLHGALGVLHQGARSGHQSNLGIRGLHRPRFAVREGCEFQQGCVVSLDLLAQNRTGFRNLVKLASAASLEGFYFKPRIDKQILEAHSEGIICLSGCVSSEFSRAILRGTDTEQSMKEAMEIASWFHRIFGDVIH